MQQTVFELRSAQNINKISKSLIENYSEDIEYFIEESYHNDNGSRYKVLLKMKHPIIEEKLAETLEPWVTEVYEPIILSELMKNSYLENNNDKKTIIRKIKKKNSLFSKSKDRDYIVKILTHYLENNNELYIEGFMLFRLVRLRDRLTILMCEAIEEFYLEKEYREFIELLKLYISEIEPKINLLHISRTKNGEFEFFDFKKEKIEVNLEKNTVSNPIEIFLTNEDMLLSILIALAPKRIIMHNVDDFENQNLINTLSEIFENKFTLCTGCELCHKE